MEIRVYYILYSFYVLYICIQWVMFWDVIFESLFVQSQFTSIAFYVILFAHDTLTSNLKDVSLSFKGEETDYNFSIHIHSFFVFICDVRCMKCIHMIICTYSKHIRHILIWIKYTYWFILHVEHWQSMSLSKNVRTFSKKNHLRGIFFLNFCLQ